MIFESSVEIDRPADAVFAVFSDVDRLAVVDGFDHVGRPTRHGPLRVGSQARIRQPKLPPATWTVTELVPGRSFTWEARGPGVRTIGRHEVEPTAPAPPRDRSWSSTARWV